jgi:hypothetical protein
VQWHSKMPFTDGNVCCSRHVILTGACEGTCMCV